MTWTKTILGILIVLAITGVVIITNTQHNLSIEVNKNNTIFKIDNRTAATETVYIEGLNMTSSVSKSIKGNNISITRSSKSGNITISHKYVFTQSTDIEDFPLIETITVTKAKGKILVYKLDKVPEYDSRMNLKYGDDCILISDFVLNCPITKQSQIFNIRMFDPYTNNWSLSSAVYVQNFNVSNKSTAPRGVFFKPDGLRMYIVASSINLILEYNLTNAWNISSAVYLRNTTIVTIPLDVFFRDDGLKMYIPCAVPGIFEYNLSDPWNVSSAVYLRNISVPTNTPVGISFKTDGLRMYFIDYSDDIIREYSLGDAWNISSAIYLRNISTVSQDNLAQGMFFKPDGLSVFMIGDTSNSIYKYDLSTAWNITTAIYTSNISIASNDTAPVGLFFKNDGLKMYFIGDLNNMVYEYNLGTIINGYSANINLSIWDFNITKIRWIEFGNSSGNLTYYAYVINQTNIVPLNQTNCTLNITVVSNLLNITLNQNISSNFTLRILINNTYLNYTTTNTQNITIANETYCANLYIDLYDAKVRWYHNTTTGNNTFINTLNDINLTVT